MSDEAQTELVGLQNALLNTDSMEQFLHELAVLSTSVVADGLSCGMSVRPRGRPTHAAACSDPLASAADQVQFQSGDGPGLYAIRHARPARIDDTSRQDRCPRFCRRAVSWASLPVTRCR